MRFLEARFLEALIKDLNERFWQERTKVARLTAALEAYACPGIDKCREPKLKDGSCLVEATGGRCGDEAYCALRALDLSAAPLRRRHER